MMSAVDELHARLCTVLNEIAPVAIAVSGGVDSMTLATVAHQHLGDRALMVHAISPAVPDEATRRVRAETQRQRWRLREVDAREFDDERYVSNPVNRCYYCKTNLYDRVTELCIDLQSDHTIVSGANADDLSDYRPGLQAASEHGVQHPFVEVGANKSDVRALARLVGLGDISELPSSPCLSSRIETGISIQPRTLRFVDEVEQYVRIRYGYSTVRCRLRQSGVVLELSDSDLVGTSESQRLEMLVAIDTIAARHGQPIGAELETYTRGSAFVHAVAPPKQGMQ